MFRYYLELALRSLGRSPGLTALMVFTIGFGVAASMTTWSVFRAVSGDPIPWKSSRLFVPQIDIWKPIGKNHDLNNAFDYTDAVALMRDHRGRLQSAMYQIAPSVVPADAARHPVNVAGEAVFGEFFPMVDAPFKYGSGWSTQDDADRARVVVLSDRLNQKVFGDVDSVGRTVNIEGKDYRVAGVLRPWNPQPRYYDVVSTGGFVSGGAEDVFLPFNTAIDVGMPNDGPINCNEIPKGSGFVGLQQSSCVWISYMVELDSAAEVASYRNYLDGYLREQQQAGRFNWPPRYKLSNLPTWLNAQGVVPDDTKVSLLVALGLLIVCLVNTAGLLLAKFLRRSGEIGVRRALGAPRSAIYAQFLTEAGMIGAAGGVVGLLFTGIGVACVGWVLPSDIARLARLDVSLLGMTLLVAVVATMLAGLYPTWRASRVQPAWQIKSN